MPLKSGVGSTSGTGGTDVTGTVEDQGPGAQRGYVADVVLVISPGKITYVSSKPAAKRYKQLKTGIAVWWRNVAIPKRPGKSFSIRVKAKPGATGTTAFALTAMDPAKGAFTTSWGTLDHDAKGAKVGRRTPSKKA